MNILDEINAKVTNLERTVLQLLERLNAPAPVAHEKITLKEAAIILKRSVDTVRRGCKAERWPHHRNGREIYFFRDELMAHLEKKPTTSASIARDMMAGKRN